jgi:phage protein D/phage baseplate assembly protein gpV
VPRLQQIDSANIVVKVAGSIVQQAQRELREVVVDLSLHAPSMFTITLSNPNMHWNEEATFREGKEIEIQYGIGETAPEKILSGRIASVEPQIDVENATIVLRGYDLSHKLYRGRYRRSFLDTKDSDLAQRLAGEAGLSVGTIDATSVTHKYLFQNNQTNAEFLLERARRIGYEMWVDDQAKFNFRKLPPSPPIAATLEWGNDLLAFSPRLSTAEQVNEVEVRGWDVKQKKAIVGTATSGTGEPQIGVSGGAGIAQTAWGQAKLAIVDEFIADAGEAKTLAQALLDEQTGAFVEAHGTCLANVKLVPGKLVEIKQVGTRFNGKYYLTQVTHEWIAGETMVTRFTASGKRDRGLWGLLAEPALEAGAHGTHLIAGVVIGIVTNNKDPDELCRVKVKFPWISANDESNWARVVTPMAGKDRGIFYLPEIDDEVLVGFEHGDIHRPYVLGSVYNGKDATPIKAADAVGGDGLVNKRVMKSRTGHMLTINDTAGGEQLLLVDKTTKNKITLNSPDNTLKIEFEGDITIDTKGKLIIKSKAGIEITSEAKISIKAKQDYAMESSLGKLTLAGQAGAEMSSQAAIKITGQTGVEAASQAQLKLSGQAGAEMSTPAMLKMSGQGGAEVSTSANLSLKGSLVNIQGSGPVSISGALVKLN